MFLSLLFSFFLCPAHATPDRAQVSSLLSQLAWNGCAKVPAQKWAGLLLLNRPITHRVKFAKGCDIQGTVTITREPFPVDLAVRNVPGVTNIKGTIATEVTPRLKEAELDVTVKATDGRIIGVRGGTPGEKAENAPAAELAAFTATYTTAIGIDGKPKGPASGEYHITRYKSAKVDIHEKMPVH